MLFLLPALLGLGALFVSDGCSNDSSSKVEEEDGAPTDGGSAYANSSDPNPAVASPSLRVNPIFSPPIAGGNPPPRQEFKRVFDLGDLPMPLNDEGVLELAAKQVGEVYLQEYDSIYPDLFEDRQPAILEVIKQIIHDTSERVINDQGDYTGERKERDIEVTYRINGEPHTLKISRSTVLKSFLSELEETSFWNRTEVEYLKAELQIWSD